MTVAPASTSRNTTAPAAIVAPSPTFTEGAITAPRANHDELADPALGRKRSTRANRCEGFKNRVMPD